MAEGLLQLWAFICQGEVRTLAVLCDRHAPEMVEYMASTKMDPPVSFQRVSRPALVEALTHDERHGRTGCVPCGPGDTWRIRSYPGMPRPTAAEMVGEVGQA